MSSILQCFLDARRTGHHVHQQPALRDAFHRPAAARAARASRGHWSLGLANYARRGRELSLLLVRGRSFWCRVRRGWRWRFGDRGRLRLPRRAWTRPREFWVAQSPTHAKPRSPTPAASSSSCSSRARTWRPSTTRGASWRPWRTRRSSGAAACSRTSSLMFVVTCVVVLFSCPRSRAYWTKSDRVGSSSVGDSCHSSSSVRPSTESLSRTA